MMVRGGGVPAQTTAFDAVVKNGSTASELSLLMRITASWSGSSPHRIQGCGTNVRAPHASSTSDFRHPDRNKRAVVLEPV